VDAHNRNSGPDEHHTKLERAPLRSDRAWAPRMTRIGATLRSLVLFTCGAVFLGASAMILDPTTLLAGSRPLRDDAAALELRRRDFLNALAALVSDCTEILAVHQRGPTPYAEIVLWVNDIANPGVIDPQEIAVISHSQPLHAVTIYSLPGTDFWAAVSDANQYSGSNRSEKRLLIEAENSVSMPRPANQKVSIGPISRQVLTQPAFCDRWRALSAVVPRTIAAGISDMRIVQEPPAPPLGPAGDNANDAGTRGEGVARGGVGVGGGELSVFRILLTWTNDSADARKEASAVVDRSSSPRKRRPRRLRECFATGFPLARE
jgi:hypothetical protein